jgi:hypothetical protein
MARKPNAGRTGLALVAILQGARSIVDHAAAGIRFFAVRPSKKNGIAAK